METNTQQIRILPKPENISFEDIRNLLQRAHATNREVGLYYNTPNQTARELEQRIQNGGVCMVAMDGDKLVGTGSLDFRQVNRWYYRGMMAHFQMDGVLPEYRGRKLGKRLIDARMDYVREKGVKAMYFTSAEKNLVLYALYKKYGFVKVDYFAAPKDNFFSVIYVSWLDRPAHSKLYVKLRYSLKRLYVRLFTGAGKKTKG